MDMEQQKMSVDFLPEFDLVAAPACEFSKDLKKKNNGKYNPSTSHLSINPQRGRRSSDFWLSITTKPFSQQN